MSELRIGTEPQSIKLRIELTNNLFYIASYRSISKIKFNQHNSSTYKKISNETLYPHISKLIEGVLSSDYIYFNETNNEKYNIAFISGLETEKDNSGGLIGLSLDDPTRKKYNNYSFIQELKKVKIIKDYYFIIKYINNFSSNLIIGDLPHKYDNTYNINNYKDIYSDVKTNEIIWNLKFDKIYTVNSSNSSNIRNIDERINVYFIIELNVIEGTENYRYDFLNTFYKENKNLCFEVLSDNYYTYYCNDKVDISKLKNLNFFNQELNYTFELSYNDLFFYNEKDGNYYFLIIFKDYSEEDYPIYSWKLGEPIFKKYEIFFNKDNKKIGIYIPGDNKEKEKETESETKYEEEQIWWSRNKWYVILIIILVLLFIGLSVTIFLYIKNRPRKKIANELNDDDYEYEIAQKNNLIN